MLGRCALGLPSYPSRNWEVPEVVASCYHFQFAGQGQRKTPVADAKTLVQIILLLLGEPFLNRPHDLAWGVSVSVD